MNAYLKHTPVILLCLFPASLLAQQSSPAKIIESIAESHAGAIRAGTDVALIIEDLENFAEHPININATNKAELSRLYILNAVQIDNLLDYIETLGPAYTIFELQSIDGFSKDVLEKIQPFVYFGEKQKSKHRIKNKLKKGRHQLLVRGLGDIQKARAYKTGEAIPKPYEGNRFRYYTRYGFSLRDKLSFGFTGEKDPGEAFFRASNKHGFDYNSAHLSFKLNETVENITVGDFIIRSGQGLVIWQGYTTGKSENVLSIAKTGQGIRAYTSVDENLYFRGITSTLNIKGFNLSLFYSRKHSDANTTIDSAFHYFTSLQTSGYHRTPNEIEDEKSVKNTNFGALASRNFGNLKIGASFVFQKFDLPFLPGPQLYNKYRFKGSENFTVGTDYLFSKGKYQLFGEVAMSRSKGIALVNGAITNLNDQLSFSVLLRHFDKNFHALWANTFAEGSNISNESGLYLGARFLPVKYVAISAYSDIYRSQWISFTTAGPSRNWDLFSQIDFRLSKTINFYIRLKNEEKEHKVKANNLYVNAPERIGKYRIHFQFKPSKSIILKTRAEHVTYQAQHKEHGFLLFQDIQFSPKKLPLNFSARIAYFDTESYKSRIYAYENDILYTFSIPAYFGQGFRNYLNLKYKMSKRTEFWLKLANTHWIDREIVGSGHNEIAGRNKTELKLQLRLKF